jgi:hypothetical protein
MRLQVLAVVCIKMTVFWVVAPYSLVEFYQHFRRAYRLHYQGNDGHNDGGSKHL